jgi:putative ABC transport system permease protein
MSMARSPWRLGARTLRRNKLRTALMGSGFLIGVVAITLTQATGDGARLAVRRSFRAMIGDLDVLLVQPGGVAQRGRANLETTITTLVPGDAEAIRQSVPNVRDVGVSQVALDVTVEAGGKSGSVPLFATSPNWAAIRGDSLRSGAFFSEADEASLNRVAVIGSDVARDYFPAGRAVGEHLRLKGLDFTVVGVIAPNGPGPGGISMDNIAYIPVATARRRVLNRDFLNIIDVKLADPSRWAETTDAVRTLVRQRHGAAGSQLDDFRVASPEAMMARLSGVDTTLRKALSWTGALALLIGGVVVANLMFAAATTRRSEIAVRRAVGATERDILYQFWSEATWIAGGAALLGALLANAAVLAGARAMRLTLAVSWPTTVGVIALTLAVGMLAGYLPARRASRIPPADLLRSAG